MDVGGDCACEMDDDEYEVPYGGVPGESPQNDMSVGDITRVGLRCECEYEDGGGDEKKTVDGDSEVDDDEVDVVETVVEVVEVNEASNVVDVEQVGVVEQVDGKDSDEEGGAVEETECVRTECERRWGATDTNGTKARWSLSKVRDFLCSQIL